MNRIIENAIEEYADKNQKLPTQIELTEKEYKILEREERREKESIGETLENFNKFRGCKLVINKNISSFRVK